MGGSLNIILAAAQPDPDDRQHITDRASLAGGAPLTVTGNRPRCACGNTVTAKTRPSHRRFFDHCAGIMAGHRHNP